MKTDNLCKLHAASRVAEALISVDTQIEGGGGHSASDTEQAVAELGRGTTSVIALLVEVSCQRV